MIEPRTTGFYSPASLSSIVTSRIPLIGTARKLKRALSRPSVSSASSIEFITEPTSTIQSGSSTPLIRPTTPTDLSMTQFDTALCLSSLRNANPNSNGIDWVSASLGHQMLIAASHRDDLISRTMYIDGLKYLQAGLPIDLSESELQSLRAFLPSTESDVSQKSAEQPRPDLVRTSTARIVTCLIAFFVLVLPILATLADKILECERRYRLIDRLASASGQIMQSAGAAGVTLGGQIVRLSQRQGSAYALVGLVNLAHSVFDGVSDGLEKSLESREMADGTRKLALGD